MTTDFHPIASIAADWMTNPGNPLSCLVFVYIPIMPLLAANLVIKNVKQQLLKQLDLLRIKRTVLELAKSWFSSNFCCCFNNIHISPVKNVNL